MVGDTALSTLTTWGLLERNLWIKYILEMMGLAFSVVSLSPGDAESN